MVTIMKENVKERKIREEERLRQIQFDIESMAEYNRILDAQEKVIGGIFEEEKYTVWD